MTDSYLEWVVEDLKKIEQAISALESASGDKKEEMNGVFQVSRDIKGQGGSFGYDLMTAIGNELCRFIKKKPIRLAPVRLRRSSYISMH